jgi:hypothetical protein
MMPNDNPEIPEESLSATRAGAGLRPFGVLLLEYFILGVTAGPREQPVAWLRA